MSKHVSVRQASRSLLAMILLLSIFVTSFVLAPVSASAGVSIPMKVTTSNMRMPTGTYTKGESASIGGHLKVNYGRIYKVSAYIQNTKNGKKVCSSVFKPNAQETNLGPHIKNFSVKKLPAGSYRYKVVAYTEFKNDTDVFVVAESSFKVVNKTPVISIKYEQHPSRLVRGEKGRFAGTVSTSIGIITYIHAEIEDEYGSIIMSTTYKPKKMSVSLKSTINADLPMAILPVGKYYYTLTAKAKGNGVTVSSILVDRARIRVIK